MKIKTEERLISDISSKKFDPLYLFTGNDSYKKTEIINLIKKSLDDFDISIHYAREIEPLLFINDISSGPLFASKKIVLLKNFESIKKEPKKIVLEYLKNSANLNLLIITIDDEIKNSELEKDFSEINITHTSLNPPTPREIENYIKDEFDKNSKIIDPASLSYISRSIASYGALVNETEKLLTYLKHKKQINLDETIDLISPNPEIDRFEIINAILSNNKQKLYEITENLIEQKEQPTLIISTLLLSLEKLLKITIIKKLYTNDYSLAYSLGVFRNELNINTFRFISENKIIKAIEQCLSIEKSLKSTTTYDPYILIRSAIYVISGLMTF